jgi:hypothetical protein
VQVLPVDGLEAQGLADRGFGLRVLALPVVAHRLPEVLDEAGLVAVAALSDDRRDRIRVVEGEPPAHRGPVVLDVEGVAGDAELVQQGCSEVGERVEGAVELVGGRCVGQSEAQVIGGDHVVPVGQHRYEVAEHERTRRVAVQQHHIRGVGRVCPASELLG